MKTRRKKNTTMCAEIITDAQPTVNTRPIPNNGWGEKAHSTTVGLTGRVMEISVQRNGEQVFGIHIADDGKLHVTLVGGYMQYADSHVLRPTRPWKART